MLRSILSFVLCCPLVVCVLIVWLTLVLFTICQVAGSDASFSHWQNLHTCRFGQFSSAFLASGCSDFLEFSLYRKLQWIWTRIWLPGKINRYVFVYNFYLALVFVYLAFYNLILVIWESRSTTFYWFFGGWVWSVWACECFTWSWLRYFYRVWK